MEKNIILLFSDLEGTILRELDGLYSDEDMEQFLSQIDKLQTLTNSQVKIHLVSPVYQKQMEEVMSKIDRNIIRYNRVHRDSREIQEIESAAAYPEIGMSHGEFLGDRITELKRPINERDFDTARYGKAHYVRTWCESYKENDYVNLKMAIYCGNGRNDLTAMDYINGKVEGKRRGLVVCPDNTRREAKAKAFHVSSKTDLLGIAEGIEAINKEIEKRIQNQENPDQRFKRAPGGVEL